MGCNFVSSPAGADWAIYVTASAREYNIAEIGGMKQYYCYADARIIIDKSAGGKRIYENQLSEKGGHTLGYDQAAREAYKYLSPKISAAIRQQIQQ